MGDMDLLSLVTVSSHIAPAARLPDEEPCVHTCVYSITCPHMQAVSVQETAVCSDTEGKNSCVRRQ